MIQRSAEPEVVGRQANAPPLPPDEFKMNNPHPNHLSTDTATSGAQGSRADELVERCAKAVFDHLQAQNPTDGSTWENGYPEARDEVRQFVRVILEAAAVPAMYEALKDIVASCDFAPDNSDEHQLLIDRVRAALAAVDGRA